MNKIFNKFVRNMFNALETTQISAETFLQSFSTIGTDTSRKELVRDYLLKNYDNGQFNKVNDFPLNVEWINTAKPLSIFRDFKGKVVLLDFFTYCCINCMHVLPDLKFLENKFSIEDGFVVVGVHSAKFTNERQSKNIAAAVKRYGVTHAVINDSEGTIWNSFDVHCWPTLVLIGPNAELLLVLQGEGHLELLNCFVEVTLDFMKERDVLSNHPLSQICVTDELKSFEILSFPGKITAYVEDVTTIAISDTGNHRILVLDQNNTIKHTIGGIDSGFKDGDFNTVRFNAPQGLVFKNSNTIYVADTENHAIREIDLNSGLVKTVAGTGKQGDDRVGGKLWSQQVISSPWDVCFGSNKDVLLIAMAGNHQIWALYLSNEEDFFKKGIEGECKAIVGSGREENRNNFYPHAAAFAQPSGLTYCSDRNSVFIADSESSCVRELNLETGKVSAVVGGSKNPHDLFAFGDKDGVGTDAKLQHLLGVTWSDHKKKLYVADSYNHKLKIVDVTNNSCQTVDVDAELNEPGGLCALKHEILIANTNRHCIERYDVDKSIISKFMINDSKISKNVAVSITKESSLSVTNEVNISCKGGEINFQIHLHKSQDLSLTEEAPNAWVISFAGEKSNSLSFSKIKKDLKLDSNFSIEIPANQDGSQMNILFEGTLYVCQGTTCSMKKLSFNVTVNYLDSATDIASCHIDHDII